MHAIKCHHRPGHIAVITADLMRYPGFAISLQNLKVPAGSSWNWVRGNGIALNRNMCVEEATGEWVWFIDDDHEFESDLLMRLLDRRVDIVEPLVMTRKPPFRPYIYFKVKAEHTTEWMVGYRSPEPHEMPRSGIWACDAVGTGGCLIQRPIFEALEKPYFQEGHRQKDALGEDLTFMEHAGEKGFQPYVDLDTRMGHTTPMTVWPGQDADGRWCVEIDMLDGPRVRIPLPQGKSDGEI